MHPLKDMPIRFKLFLVYAIVTVAILAAGLTLYYYTVKHYLEEQIRSELIKSNQTISSIIETAAKVSIKNYLRAIAEKNLDIVDHLYSHDYRLGLLSEQEAKNKAGEILLNQKIGETGYIYCINSQGTVVLHPNQEVMGQNYAKRDFIAQQIRNKTGYLEYIWENPGETGVRPKALGMAYFEPWDWIISVSSYRSEFSSLVSNNDFRQQILNMKSNKGEYSFVMDSKGNSIVHPELANNLMEYAASCGTNIIETIIREKSGIINYQWKNPRETVFKDKIVAYEFIPDFDWFIASCVCKEDAFAPLKKLRSIFYIILVAAIFIMAGASLVVSRTITNPLTRIVERFDAGQENSLKIIPVTQSLKNEIGLLENSYNQFVHRLNSYRQSLQAENKIRKKAETQLLLFETVFEHAHDGISITSPEGEILAVNQAFTDITGYTQKEVIGQNPRILKSEHHDSRFYREMWQSIIHKGCWSGEIWNRRKNGEAFPEFLSISAVKDEHNHTKNYVAVFHDISEMKTKEKQIEHMAYHDPLTGLPNRILLKDRLEHTIAGAMRKNEMIQLLFIDIDNFKLVNDSAGHAKGDELLKEAAARMLSVTRAGDTVARLGGDEFIIMVTGINDMMEIIKLVERLQSEFHKPFVIDEIFYHLTCSIGISVFPNDGSDSETLLRHADLAMYHSKGTGKNKFFLFEPEMARKIAQRIEMEMDMRRALENDEFQAYFQPQVNNRSLKPVGMEALIRWVKKDGTVVSPGLFIPLAEESGLIVPIGKRIFEKAVAQICQIREQTGYDLIVAVNVSVRQFDEDGFVRMVEETIHNAGLPADRLKIEITESLLMKNIEKTMARLKNLAAVGVTTAIDDFGTGYSSLAYLKSMPISILKIDKSFIDDVDKDLDAHALVETIVLMANKLSMTIVAEGVETQAQLEKLNMLGEMEIQGYLFARPMPMEETIDWLEHSRPV